MGDHHCSSIPEKEIEKAHNYAVLQEVTLGNSL